MLVKVFKNHSENSFLYYVVLINNTLYSGMAHLKRTHNTQK